MKRLTFADEAALIASNAAAFAGDLLHPTIRLGVTGLSRAGKTVFITSLIHNLVHGGHLPLFRPFASGRITRAYLQPQPDDGVPRFDYEGHLAALRGDTPHWPESTTRLSQLRLTLDYEPDGFVARNLGRGELNIDIVDYPGEWLLDLPLLAKSYQAWSRETLALSRHKARSKAARKWHAHLATLDPAAPADEHSAIAASDLFKGYLKSCREDHLSLSTLPPGRFLMPGDMDGSPALTFSPLDIEDGGPAPSGSLAHMMARRYEAYKALVVKPFFKDHFARLDRQIVLVDLFAPLNAGPAATSDLERALGDILKCFRTGSNSILSHLFARRIERILFAATKADHLHHQAHGAMEAILERLVRAAIARADFKGAEIGVMALSAIRATREEDLARGGEPVPCVLGYPLPGEQVNATSFDGRHEIAVFPGDLPGDPETLFADAAKPAKQKPDDLSFVRFQPPPVPDTGLPHIRLDRALEFLIADKIK